MLRRRRTVESRRNAAMTMFASTTSRRGAARKSLPACLTRGFVPPAETLLHQVVEFLHVGDRERAPTRQGVQPLEGPNPLSKNPSDDLAQLDFGMALHLTVQPGGVGRPASRGPESAEQESVGRPRST